MAKLLKILVFAIVSLVLVFTPLKFAAAQSPNPSPSPIASPMEVSYEDTNPNDGFSYITKRLGEKVKLILLSFSPGGKENFYKELANRRLAELKYVIENKDLNSFEIATIRYSTTIGEWTEHILAKKLDDKKKPAIEILSNHLPVVEQLMLGFNGTTAEWRFVKQDFDYINIYKSKLQE